MTDCPLKEGNGADIVLYVSMRGVLSSTPTAPSGPVTSRPAVFDTELLLHFAAGGRATGIVPAGTGATHVFGDAHVPLWRQTGSSNA